VDLPSVVRSSHTWDTTIGRDLRGGEEAIVVSAEDYVNGIERWSRWTLISLDRPRLIELNARGTVETVLKRWLKPVDLT
jgi:hypothetical protein